MSNSGDGEGGGGGAGDNLNNSTVNDKFKCQPCNPLKILKFIECISSTTNSIQMQILINKYLQELTNSPYVFLIPLLPSNEEGLIQVIGDRKLDKEIRFSVSLEDLNGETFIGCTDDSLQESTKNSEEAIETTSSGDLNEDESGDCVQVSLIEPNKSVAEIIEMVVGKENNTLIFDIKNSKNLSWSTTTAATTTTFNHHQQNEHQQKTTSSSLYVCIAGNESQSSVYSYHIKETFRYILGHLLTAFDLYEEKLVRKQCQNLLEIARRLLGKIGDLGKLLRSVMVEAKNMTNAERCSLFLIDWETNELVSKVFDGDEAAHEVRIEEGQGIAGYVSKSGKLLNIRNAYQHPLFYKGVDEQTGFKTRNILCFPICDEERIIGVAQLCNKANGFHFDKCDEQIATAFSIYCGISIMHSLVHRQVQKAEARHKLSQELLTYHMTVTQDDVITLRRNVANKVVYISDFSSFSYNPRETEVSITMELSMQMFIDLNFINRFKINEDKLARFLLIVRKGYRDVIPYHNWTHGFSVAHFSYSLMMNLKLIEREIITELQGLSFLIACFCHDLDHRGTNNSFQVEAKSPLARLYSSEGSVNERHHLSQAICLLNEESCRILDCLNTDEFKECIDLMRHLILATDLANHFRILNDLKNLTPDNLKENRMLLMSLLITCCDLSDQTLPWPMTKKIANLLYTEFFAQGDLERQMGLAPNQMMDRNRACIPQLQIEFLSGVVRPTFEILCNVFPETGDILSIIDDNRTHWESVNQEFENCS